MVLSPASSTRRVDCDWHGGSRTGRSQEGYLGPVFFHHSMGDLSHGKEFEDRLHQLVDEIFESAADVWDISWYGLAQEAQAAMRGFTRKVTTEQGGANAQ